MKNQFWHLCSEESGKRRIEWDHNKMDLEQIVCPIHSGHQRAGKRVTNLSITLPALPMDDLLWTWYSECIISDLSLQLFQNCNFTGFETKPVLSHPGRNSSRTIPKLWELVIVGWAGIAPPESGIKLIESCSGCGLLRYSCFDDPEKLINESKWDGSDFFIVWPLPRFIFVTDRVKKAIEEKGLRGGRFIASKDLKCINDLGPGRLSHIMPDNRARMLGKSLGIY
jgi:hypothetical protein